MSGGGNGRTPPLPPGVRQAVSRGCRRARSAIQCRSADSLPCVRCRLRSAFVRASHRLTLSRELPEGAVSVSIMMHTSSMYCANVMWGRGLLGGARDGPRCILSTYPA